jgi:hypothetical protein
MMCNLIEIKDSKKYKLRTFIKITTYKTHLGWPSGIGLEPRSVLLQKVSGSILSGADLRGLV